MTDLQEAVGVDVLPRSTAGARILVIDDDKAMRSVLGRALVSEGLATDLAGTASEGLKQARDKRYDLVILDLLMPATDGIAVLRQLLRDRPGQTVLVLSCVADVRYTVDCFDLGARDYLTKPFSLEELLARVRNQLRGLTSDRVMRAGGITLFIGRMEVDIGEGLLSLTRLEFLVLKELMEHVGQSMSKFQLLEAVWGYGFDPGSNIVGVCVRRLRSKIGDQRILTVRGKGYQLAAG
jgi:two-component system copper resistance phosphate regulon response regulator CusR